MGLTRVAVVRVWGEGRRIRRVVLCPSASGAFLYLYDALEGGLAIGEEWYESIAAGEDACRRRFGVGPADWHPFDLDDRT